MSSYTITLKRICDLYTRNEVETWFKDYEISDFLTPDQIASLTNWGLFSKDKLASKIVDNYFLREIGYETPSLFKLKVKGTMAAIMEEYLPLFYSYSLKYDPLVNVDFTETFTRNIDGSAQNKGTSNSSSNSNNDNFSILNNTPQTNINKQDLENGFYASQVTQTNSTSDINDTTSTSSDGTSSTQETYERKQKGNSGISATAQKLLDQYRDTIRPLEKEIIEKLNPLFMGIY